MSVSFTSVQFMVDQSPKPSASIHMQDSHCCYNHTTQYCLTIQLKVPEVAGGVSIGAVGESLSLDEGECDGRVNVGHPHLPSTTTGGEGEGG